MLIFVWSCILLGSIGVLVARFIYRREYKELTQYYDGRSLGIGGCFVPAGYFFTKKFYKYNKSQRKKRYFEQLVPREKVARVCQVEQAQKIGFFLGFLMVGFFLTGCVLLSNQYTAPLTKRFQRGDYEEGDRTVSMQAIIQQDGQTVQQEIQIPIPQQEATEEQKHSWLEAGISFIRRYFMEHGPYTEEPDFPERFGQVTFSYFSKEPEWIQDNGVLLGSWPVENRNVSFDVTVWASDLQETIEVEVEFCGISQLSPERQLEILQEEIQAGEYTTEKEVVLPDKTTGGQSIRWTTKEIWGSPWLWIGIFCLAGVVWGIRRDRHVKEEVRKKDKQMLRIYPEMVNEITILISAGLTLQNAWIRIVDSYEKRKEERGSEPLYEAMRQTVIETKNGLSFAAALRNFGDRSQIKEIKKFTRILIADRKRGDTRMLEYLREMNEEAWELRKKQVREKSEEADMRLLLPLMMMLVVILIIVLAPAMLTIRG